MKKVHRKQSRGFTLIEILVVIGIIAILAAVVLIAINPARQFKQAHDSQRLSNANAILNAIGQNIADNKGSFNCPNAIPTTTAKDIASSGGVDLRNCIVPTYMAEIPFDPTIGSFSSATVYDTKYFIQQDASTSRITITATPEIASTTISITR